MARTILQQRDALLSQYASEKVLRRSLRLGVTELAALTWLPGFIDALRSTYLLVDVELEVGGVAVELYEKLRLAQLDLAIVPDTPRWADIVRFPLANLRNGWFCSPAFSLKRRRLAVSDLGQYVAVPIRRLRGRPCHERMARTQRRATAQHSDLQQLRGAWRHGERRFGDRLSARRDLG